MTSILPTIHTPQDLQGLDDVALGQLAQEMRDELVRVLAPVLVGDVAEPVVERLPVWLLPDRALPPGTTRLMHAE